MHPTLMTCREAAEALKIHPITLERLLAQGKLPGYKLANRWLVERDAFEAFQKTYVGKKGRPKGYSPKRGASE